ncbi:UDP-glucose pyrophosphorylase [Staphylococcus carnosus]|uniref:UTP--glucose-1-phosphate uridylyltransferase n=1 Tax=Staphylococcus carnosus (strain TM300) TaxID=396513 RepID=B9DJT3_STACT|nr:hypothetical protein SCA04_18050 [Staphylococcus carnosus]GEP78967.1 hypothetical protein SCA05_07600 [Staphylococcus carnosus]CAL29084.1 truncated UDP-glucose pyrophosphorylase [Staphylococcus carnosus subsp. carnosus TM300]SUL89335.1 UDP-glucose pyrophosphorylase [Staphylococcus carnosus]SUM04976.1 UDP-glucose pyrophosphorylase [Staphylococcus carnosus]
MNLESNGKFKELEKTKEPTNLVNLFYVRQKEQKGLGDAVLCAKQFIGNEPFAILLGDDIVKGETPAIKQLMQKYEETGKSVIGVQEVQPSETHRYGIINPISSNGRLYQVNNFVEKPKEGTAPSNLAIMGRYVLSPQIFNYLENQGIGAGGEVQLTDAIERLNQDDNVFAYDFEGKRYDVGEKIGFVKTTIDFALNNDDMKDEITKFLKNL